MKTIPTISEIQTQIISDIDSAQGSNTPILTKAVWRILSKAIAVSEHLLYRFGSWLYYQIFTSSMDSTALIARGAEYGLTKTPALCWQGTATATGTDGTAITAGTLYSLSGVVYSVREATEVSGGSATLSLESLTTGDDTTPTIGGTLNLVSPQTGLDATATVATTTQSGQDIETDSAFRSRITFRQQNQPQGGAFADWISWSLEVSGIGEVTVERPAAGFVNVYPLTDESDPADRIPGSTLIATLKSYLTSDARCPLRAAEVDVIAPTELSFDVDITGLSPSNATLQAAIETAIESYMYARRPEQYSDSADPQNEITAAELYSEAIGVGAKSLTLTLKNAGGSSISSYTLEKSELSVLRTLTWL